MNNKEDEIRLALIKLKANLNDIKLGPCPVCGSEQIKLFDQFIFLDEADILFKCPLGHVTRIKTAPTQETVSLPVYYAEEPIERPLGTSAPEYAPMGGGTD